MTKRLLAWHFVGNTLRDGSPIPRNGKWLIYNRPIELCHSGFHASINAYDALQYAPGPILCRVECGGQILLSHDKLVCTERKILERIDSTALLKFFARQQALSVLKNWKEAPPQIVLDYLMTGNETLRSAAWSAARSAARSAAQSAARSSAWSAAWSAARSAARSAAQSAAWSAAQSAAQSAARSAAWSAAQSAARSAAWSAAQSAAQSAAWSAAQSAAWSAARKMWNDIVIENFKE